MKSITNSLLSALLLMMLVPNLQVFAQDDTKDVVPAYQPPADQKLAPVVLPPIKEKVLKNGLKVVVVEHHELPLISFRLMCKAGSQLDPNGKAGLTDFMAGLLEKGTESLSATDIADKIDNIGGNLGTGSGWATTYVSCTSLKKHLDIALDLMQDVVLNPSFPEEEIERSRQQRLSGIENSKDQPRTVASLEYNKWLFGDHPYAYPSGGNTETVTAITREDILTQYDKVFVPGNSVLFVVGDVKPKEGFKLAKNAFGGWAAGDVPTTEYPEPQAPSGYKIHLVDKPDATQAQIQLGHLGVARDNEDYFPVVLMNYVLGGGGFSSRLVKVIRSELGLTYGIRSSFSARQEPGPFTISTFTKNESAGFAIEETIKLVKTYMEEGPTDQEIFEAKSYLNGSYPLNFETPSSIARQLQSIEIYNLGSDYIKKYRSRVNAVTREDIMRVAKKYLHPDDMIFVVVSKAEDVKEDLEKIGPVEVLEIEDVF